MAATLHCPVALFWATVLGGKHHGSVAELLVHLVLEQTMFNYSRRI